jgi:uncharacterized membrane protein
LARPLRAVVAAVARAVAERVVVAAGLPAVLREAVEGRARAHLAHKLLPLVRLRVVVVLAARRVALPAEVAVLWLAQGRAVWESLPSRSPFSP